MGGECGEMRFRPVGRWVFLRCGTGGVFALSGGDALRGFLHWLSSITTFPIFSLFSLCRPQAGRAVSFLCSKKKPKKAFSAEFLPSFVACATRGADSAGKRLTREEVYIETIETAGEGGGGFVCVMDTRRPVAFHCVNVGANCVRPLPRCHSEHSEESYFPYTSLKFRPDGRRRSAMPSFRLSPIWYAVTEIVPTSYGRVAGIIRWKFCVRDAMKAACGLLRRECEVRAGRANTVRPYSSAERGHSLTFPQEKHTVRR